MLYTKRADFQRISARFLISPVTARVMVNRDIQEKDMEKCSKMIFSITEVFLMMENINFETNKFSSKTLDEVKDLYRSQDMKENLEFIKESIKKILYR